MDSKGGTPEDRGPGHSFYDAQRHKKLAARATATLEAEAQVSRTVDADFAAHGLPSEAAAELFGPHATQETVQVFGDYIIGVIQRAGLLDLMRSCLVATLQADKDHQRLALLGDLGRASGSAKIHAPEATAREAVKRALEAEGSRLDKEPDDS